MVMFRARSLSRKAFVVVIALGIVDVARGQAPGTDFPGSTDAKNYAEKTNKQIDILKAIIDKFPPKLLGDLDKASAEFSLDQVKQLNESRARAEEIARNAQNAFLREVPSEAEAQLSSSDLDFVRSLRFGDVGRCGSGLLVCNGSPSEYGSLECAIGVPDPSMPIGRRAIGVVTVECVPENGRLVGRIVVIVATDLTKYRGPYTKRDGGYISYTGTMFSGFCTPCPDPTLKLPK
jgi:hypothetical protein